MTTQHPLLHPFRRAAAIVAACAVLALGVVTLVATQSPPARAASVGEFTMTPESGRLSDAEPFGGSIGLPGRCPDATVEDVNWYSFLNLYVVKADGTEAPLLRGISNGAPYTRPTSTLSLAEADNPGLDAPGFTDAITGDGTYELRVYCVDNFGLGKPTEDWVPGNPYWSQRITVTGDDWAVGDGAKATSVQLTPSVVQPEPGQEITLSAAVTPTDAAGTVQFLDGGSTLGEVDVTDGKAEFKTETLSEGQHDVVARFTPTDTTEFGSSESEPVTVRVRLAQSEMIDVESGERLPGSPELRRGQTVRLIIRRCQPNTAFALAMDRNDGTFPGATSDADGTVTWPELTVPDDAVEGTSAWKISPLCPGDAESALDTVPFTVPAPPSGSPSGDPSDTPSGDPTDDPTGDPTDDPSAGPSGDPTDDPSAGPSGDTSGTTSGTTSGSTGGGVTGGGSASGGTSPTGGLASTGSQIALFSGIGAVVLVAAGVVFVRSGRRDGLLKFGDPRS